VSAPATSSRITRWRASLSTTGLGERVALGLWIAWAFCVWNVIFDRVLVLAGRRYVYAAAVTARQSDAYLKIDDWMRPAVMRGFWMATAAAAAIVALGVAGVWAAARRRPSATSPESPRKT
jgi:ABC-type Fe3+ transport system permease subunit